MKDPEHGLTQAVIDVTDLLLWWGHVAREGVSDEVVERVHDAVVGDMGLIVLQPRRPGVPRAQPARDPAVLGNAVNWAAQLGVSRAISKVAPIDPDDVANFNIDDYPFLKEKPTGWLLPASPPSSSSNSVIPAASRGQVL